MSDPTNLGERERRYQEAVAEYLRARDVGSPPSRADFLARYPDLAAELAAFLDAHEKFEHLAAPLGELLAHDRNPQEQASPGSEAVPRQIGRYRILRKIGQGGMGRVYEAHDEHLRRRVVVKVPRFDRTPEREAELRRRFLREARAAARVPNHPHVCQILDAGEHDGLPFAVMEYVEGESLWQRLATQGQFEDDRQAVEVVRQVAEGLAVVHQAGIVHRDLKPGNILLDRTGTAKLTDFGMARSPEAAEQITAPGGLAGTPSHVAPERRETPNTPPTPQSDIYSLGLVLWQLLTGCLKPDGTPPTRPFRDGLDPDLEAIVARAVAARPEDRYPSARAFAAALEGWLGRTEERPASALEVRVWNDQEPSRKGLSVAEAGALPLRNGDKIRIRAWLARPAYLYLVWIDGQGQAKPVHPWREFSWTSRLDAEAAVAELELPRGPQGYPVRGAGGIETLLLLARAEPLAADFDLEEQLYGFPSKGPLPDPGRAMELVWRMEEGTRDQRMLGEPEPIDDPELVLREFCRERLGDYFALVHGCRFVHRE